MARAQLAMLVWKNLSEGQAKNYRKVKLFSLAKVHKLSQRTWRWSFSEAWTSWIRQVSTTQRKSEATKKLCQIFSRLYRMTRIWRKTDWRQFSNAWWSRSQGGFKSPRFKSWASCSRYLLCLIQTAPKLAQGFWLFSRISANSMGLVALAIYLMTKRMRNRQKRLKADTRTQRKATRSSSAPWVLTYKSSSRTSSIALPKIRPWMILQGDSA